MVTFEEACRIVMNSALVTPPERILLSTALHRILAEDVVSDINMPPFNKAAVDGYACRQVDLADELEVIEIIPAGVMPRKVIDKGQCSKIMTGAMVSPGADVVIMVEDTVRTPAGKIRFIRQRSAANICYLAEDITKGDTVLKAGTLIRPPEVAVMASVGYMQPLVYKQVRIGVISTGDELVEPEHVPAPSQIRNSNAMQLLAQIGRMGLKGSYYGIARDTKASIRNLVRKTWRANDITVLTGGVSMGEYDYVPEVLAELDLNVLFESIAIQPGRPTLFGMSEKQHIFGLPGNPVSSFVLFELLIKPFLYRCMGHTHQPLVYRLPMGTGYSRKKSDRKSLIPVRITDNKVFPVAYHGSAHIHSYIYADGIIVLEIGTTLLEEGELVDVRQI